MNLNTVLSQDLCCILEDSSKNEVLFSLINMITGKLSLKKDAADELTKGIFYREQLMSTGIGLGIAIPHVRFKGVSEPILAVGIRKEGIPDYKSIDDEIVKVVVMIIVGESQHKKHIRLLSIIVSMCKNKETRKKLINASSGQEIYEIMTGHQHD